MPFVSLTRLRIRSIRFMPLFAPHTVLSLRQVRHAEGFLTGSLLPDRHWVFWTMTAWDSEAHMRAYLLGGAHKRAMPHLMHWCDEASVAHWTQPDAALVSWEEADHRMRTTGRASKVHHPSPDHAALTYAVPRTTAAAPIHRA